MDLSEDKVREIYNRLDEERGVKKSRALTTEGLSESEAEFVDKINTALGLS